MKISIVYPESLKMYYSQLALAFKNCLEQLQHDVIITHNTAESTELEFNLCPLHYGSFTKINKKYVMIQMEQFPTKFCSNGWQEQKWNQTKSFIHLYNAVWDTFYEFHKDLYTTIPVYNFQLGYHPSFDYYENVIKDKKASFFGSMSERRKVILSKIHDVTTIESITDFNRSDLVNHTKVNLNIHYSESNLCESLRIVVFLLSNKAFILTEDFIGDDELKKCVITTDNFSEIDYYVNHDEERNRFAENAYQYIKTHRTLLQSIRSCIDHI